MEANWSKPLVVSRLREGDIIRLLDRTEVKIISLSAGYAPSKISTDKTAIVMDVATGEQREVSLYGNQRYKRCEGQETMSDAIITTETKSFEQQMQDALNQVQKLRQEVEEKNRQEEAQERVAIIAKAKLFTDWLGLPGELAFNEAHHAPAITYQGVIFIILSSMTDKKVFVNITMFKEHPEDEMFKWNWELLRHEVKYGWRDISDEGRVNLLATIAEEMARINAAHAQEMARYEAWKTRATSATPEAHTIMFWHRMTVLSDQALSAKIDEGYRVISATCADADGVYILLSKHAAPVVKQHAVGVGYEF